MKILLTFIANIFSVLLLAQYPLVTDTIKSSYKNLPVLKKYNISSSALISADTSWFKLGGKDVDEKTYRKYTQYVDYYDKCYPCVLLGYDTSGYLHYKHIAYGDCNVGYWIEYYPNGKVKVIGHYKENTTGNWENIFERGFCKKDGTWTYFNKKGTVIYAEIWKDDKLLKRIRRNGK